MDTDHTQPPPSPLGAPPLQTEAPRPASTSLASRMFNVFATPGDVFQEVKTSPPANTNWLVPVLLASVMGIIYVLVIFSQDAVLHQLREQREKLMEKKLEKLPKEERERVMEMTEKFATPTIFKVFGSFGAVAGSFGWVFFLSLVMWLLGTKLFKADFAFMKAAEVCGLSAMISVLGIIVSMLLVVVTGNVLITPGPALLFKDFDAANKLHLALAAINVVTLWYMCVLAVGFSKLSGISWLKAFLWLATPWALFKAGTILLGLGGGGM